VHERVFVYIQPDFASGGNNIAQIRDAYFDVAFASFLMDLKIYNPVKIEFHWIETMHQQCRFQ
jgi:hypothetical protein